MQQRKFVPGTQQVAAIRKARSPMVDNRVRRTISDDNTTSSYEIDVVTVLLHLRLVAVQQIREINNILT